MPTKTLRERFEEKFPHGIGIWLDDHREKGDAYDLDETVIELMESAIQSAKEEQREEDARSIENTKRKTDRRNSTYYQNDAYNNVCSDLASLIRSGSKSDNK